MKATLHVYKEDIFNIARAMDHEPVVVEIEYVEDGKDSKPIYAITKVRT